MNDRKPARALDPPHQDQDQHDDQDDRKQAARPIAPVPTVRPTGRRSEQEQDEDDDQQRSEHGRIEPSTAPSRGDARKTQAVTVVGRVLAPVGQAQAVCVPRSKFTFEELHRCCLGDEQRMGDGVDVAQRCASVEPCVEHVLRRVGKHIVLAQSGPLLRPHGRVSRTNLRSRTHATSCARPATPTPPSRSSRHRRTDPRTPLLAPRSRLSRATPSRCSSWRSTSPCDSSGSVVTRADGTGLPSWLQTRLP